MLPNVVLFQGVDSSGQTGLWETDGTTTGTFELTGIAAAFPTGLYPVNLTPINANEVLFNGVDKGGLSGLWETDGTAAGTHELTGIARAATTAPGLYPGDLTVYGGQVLFAGYDSAGDVGLWVTTGTAAGTHELTGIAGADIWTGLCPSGFTVYNNLVFFAGNDASGAVGLWETDGTASGTHELDGVVGAATAGLYPGDLTVYNGELLFSGKDAHGQTGLWESNGTASGTLELTGIVGAPTAGQGLDPSYLTVFNGQVLFNGLDSGGQRGLWETDGTVAGTHELTGIAGASTTGIGLYPSDLTVLNSHVLFVGVDSSGHTGLWTTDGTAAGTHELTAIAGAQTKGSGLDPSDLTSYNGEVLFSGVDSGGKSGLWTTDGTAAGTHELTGVAAASSAGLAPSNLTTIATRPVLSAGASTGYVAGATPVTLDPGLSVSDAAAVNLTAATVTISAGFLAGDALSVGSPQTGITSAYNAATGVLTLTGAASLAAYQKELDSVAYASPHATASSRTITWSINDGVNTSTSATSNVSVSTVVPVLTAGATVGYVAGATPVALDAGLSVSDAAAANLTAAAVSISAGFVQGDALSVGSPQAGITSAYNAATGVLMLSGAASLAAYQKELDSVAYASPHATASSRTITWSINDGVNTSAAATSHVAVSRLPPVLTAGATVGYVAGATPVTLDAGLSITDAAAVSLSAAAVSISAGFLAGDALSVGSPQTGITSAYNAATGVLTLSGAASLAAYQKELDSVAYASPHATASSRTITWSINDGVNTSTSATSNVSVSLPPPNPPVPGPDLNIMLQNAGGRLALWHVNGSTDSGADLLGPNPGASWSEKGIGAFFTGDTSDILLQNANGQVAIWEMNGDALIGGGPVTPNPGPSWKAIGTGDFDDDGHSDILFQNASTGQVSIWEMSGNTIVGGGPVSHNPGPAWKAIGTGDFNDDGHSDILFQNASTGQVSIWEMSGNTLVGGGPVSPNPGPNWKAIGTGDFNDDLHSDIVFQNKSSGQVSIWEMDGNTLVGGGSVSPNPGPSWHAIGTDGGSDILFQNANGQTSIWDMTGTHLTGGGAVSPNLGSSWHAVGLA